MRDAVTSAARWLLAGALALATVACGTANPAARAGPDPAVEPHIVHECYVLWSLSSVQVTVVMEVEYLGRVPDPVTGGQAGEVRVVRVIQQDARTRVSPDAPVGPAAPEEDSTILVHNWSPLAEANEAEPGSRWVVGAVMAHPGDGWYLPMAFAEDGTLVPDGGDCSDPTEAERLRVAAGTDTELDAVVALLRARDTDGPSLRDLEVAAAPEWEGNRDGYLADRESYQVGLPIEPEEVDEFVRARGLDEAPTHRWEVILWFGDAPPSDNLAVHFEGVGLLGGLWSVGPMPFVMPGAHGPAVNTFEVVTWDSGLVYGVDPPRVLGTYTVDDLDTALVAMATRSSLFLDLGTGELRLMGPEEASALFMEHALD